MRNRFIQSAYNKSLKEHNIYADKSAIVLEWLLMTGIHLERFSLRQIAREVPISLGLIQRVCYQLALKGFLQTNGVRTSKTFSLQKSDLLLQSWLDHYNIVKKCKMWTYQSAYSKNEILHFLQLSKLQKKVTLALHSACEIYKCKNTNLETLELYLLDPSIRTKLELDLHLEPQERGYSILLIDPYYKSLLRKESVHEISVSPPLLTYLDLYHFPLRGREQAEFIAIRMKELNQIIRRQNDNISK